MNYVAKDNTEVVNGKLTYVAKDEADIAAYAARLTLLTMKLRSLLMATGRLG